MDISNTKINELVQRISASKTRILSFFPFYGVLIMDTKFFLDKKEKSFSTDGKNVYFNPEYLFSLSNEELDISILHEIFHIVLKHPFRYNKTMDNDLFHLAADIVVNSNIMKSNNQTTPLYVKGRMLPFETPNKKPGYNYTAEEVYLMLLKKYPGRKKALQMKNDSAKNESDNNKSEKQELDTLSKVIGPKLVNQVFNYVPERSGALYFRTMSYKTYKGQWDWYIEDEYATPKYKINPLLLTSDKLKNFAPVFKVRCRVVDKNLEYLSYPDYLIDFEEKFYDCDSTIDTDKYNFQYYEAIPSQDLISQLYETKFSSKEIEKEEKEYRKFVYKNYLGVSDLHKRYFVNFAKQRYISGNQKDIIISCRNAIAEAAKYDLKFPKNVSGKDDVLFFLAESKKGICYHFATSLVLFYRSLGIPARIVTGYLVNASSNVENFAFKESGHAWVEVYLDGTGWIKVDPTPISMSDEINYHNGNDDSNGKPGDESEDEDESDFNSFDSHERWEEAKKFDDLSEDEINSRIIKAYEIQEKHKNGCGNLPGFIESLIKSLRKPRIDWRTALNDFVQENINDYSFMIPDNRFQDSDFILPSFSDRDFEAKNILFMVDCSGSMSTKNITDCYSEIKGAIDQFNGKLRGYLGFFDTIVYRLHEIDDTVDITKLKPVGRGGTNFSSVFNYINKNMKDNPPSVIIILSDGDAPTPPESLANEIPTMWIINNKRNTPKWGKVLRID